MYLTGADCFVLAMDAMMHRNGQHGLVGQTCVELATAPDEQRLRVAAEKLFREQPLLNARLVRSPLTLLPFWKFSKTPFPGPFLLTWTEDAQGRISQSADSGTDTAPAVNLMEWSRRILNQRLGEPSAPQNLRIDLIYRSNGEAVLFCTWTHTLFDGKGAELLIQELIAMDRGDAPARELPKFKGVTLREAGRKADAVIRRFWELTNYRFHSLSGPKPAPGKVNFQLITLEPEQTQSIRNKASKLTGPLFNLAFYLACAARAHQAAFQQRGHEPDHYVISLPVQVRRKGRSTTPFLNRVSILFFHIARTDLESLEKATQSVQQQFEKMTRARLEQSFDAMLGLLRRTPARLYMLFASMHFKGEFTSFFHSHTGDFTLDSGEICGASITNAFHIPSISAPPGSGIFFSEYNGKLNITCSWRETAANQAEITAMTRRLMEDLLEIDGSGQDQFTVLAADGAASPDSP